MPIRIAPICRVPHRDIPRICGPHDHPPASSSSSSPIPRVAFGYRRYYRCGRVAVFRCARIRRPWAPAIPPLVRKQPPQCPLVERLNSPDSGISCAQGSMAAELFGLGKQNVFFLALHRAADQDFLPASPRDWLICNPAEEKRRPFLEKVFGGAQPLQLHTDSLYRRDEL